MLLTNQYNRIITFNKFNKKVVFLSVFILILTLSGLETYSQTDTVDLKEIEVFGVKPEISTKSPNPIQQLNTKKLESLPTTNVADAIRNFTGVAIKDYGGVGGLKTVMIRSLGANHTSVFIDGHPSNDISTGQIDLGRITLSDVGNIQLSTGQPEFELMPARMYASASVLDIRLKNPALDTTRSVVNISSRMGSFGTINPAISIDSKLNDKIFSGIRLNFYSAKGNFPYKVQNGSIETKLERINSDIQTTDILWKTRVLFSDSSWLNIKTSYNNSDRGLPGAVIYYNFHSSQRLRNNDIMTGIQYRSKPGRKADMLISAGFSINKLLYRDPDFQNQTGGIRNEYNQQEFYLSDAAMVLLSKKLKLSIASDLIFNKLSTNAYSINNPKRISSLTAASVIFESNQTEIQASSLLTFSNDKSEGSKDAELVRLSPALSFIQALTSDRTLKARFSYRDIYRLPSFNDLYYLIAGNISLKPETASMFDLGLLFNKTFSNVTGVNLRLDGFVNNVKHKIVTLPSQNLFIWRTVNIGRVEIKGLELSGSLTRLLNSNWSLELNGNYTYQEAVDVTDKSDDNYGHQIAYIPFETAGFLATTYYRNSSFGINTIYNGYRYYANENNPENLLDEWITTDLTFSWQTILMKQLIKLKAEATNVFDKKYEVVRGFPMTGLGIYLNIYLTIK